MAFVDHCQSAEDVRKNARLVMERRRESLLPPVRRIVEITAFNYLPNVPFARLVASAYPDRYRQSTITVRDIQIAVCQYYGISRGCLLSPRRTRDLVMPRHLAMALTSHLLPISLPAIGREFAGRDHTTVMHACRKVGAVIAAAAEKLPRDASLNDWVVTAARCITPERIFNDPWRKRKAAGV